LSALGPAIDQAAHIEDNSASANDALERLRTVLAVCGKRVGGSDPSTTPTAPLDAIAANFVGAKNEIEAFLNDRNPEHLNNANINADGALVQLSQIPGISTSEELIALMSSVNSYRESLEAQARAFSVIQERSRAGIAELARKLDSFETATDSTISNMQTQLEGERQKIAVQASEQQKVFADAQESRNNAYTESLRKIQENLSQTLTDQQAQFSSAQENRNREFASLEAELQKRVTDLISDHTKSLADRSAEFMTEREAFVADATNKLDKLFKDYGFEANNILDYVKSRHEEVQKLAGVIGNLGVTSGYLKTANSARNSMWLWQSVTIVAFVTLILFARYAFLPSMQGDFRWGAFAARVFLTITIGVVAAYAVSQADRFFKEEKTNRKLALELAAVDPFIALLPQDEQFKFKLEMARRTFVQQGESSGVASSDKSPATTLDVIFSKDGQQVLQTVAEMVKTIAKK